LYFSVFLNFSALSSSHVYLPSRLSISQHPQTSFQHALAPTSEFCAILALLLDLGWRSREPRTAPSTMIGAPTTNAIINTPPYTIND